MKKRVVSILLIAAIAAGALSGCGKSSDSGSGNGGEEGKVINIYSWNDEFRERVEAVYPEVKETSSDGTVTTLNDGTEIHWIINPNQDGGRRQGRHLPVRDRLCKQIYGQGCRSGHASCRSWD